MLQYGIKARRVDARGGVATCRSANVAFNAGVRARNDAMDPGELLLAALAASILRNLERVASQISFEFRDAWIEVQASHEHEPPRLAAIEYVLTVDTAESDRRLALLHTNVRKQGEVYNTLLPCIPISGIAERAPGIDLDQRAAAG